MVKVDSLAVRLRSATKSSTTLYTIRHDVLVTASANYSSGSVATDLCHKENMFVTISNANITTIVDPSLSDRHNDTSLRHSLTHKICQHFDYTYFRHT